jgi:transcriptional regulator with XRE-family HTH domain
LNVLSQEKLSFESGLDRSFISQLECGLKQPSLVTIFQLAKALQTSPARIIESVETLYNEP